MGDIRTRIIIDADTGQATREMGQLGDEAQDVAVRVNEVTDAFGSEGLAGTFQSGIGPLRGFTDELGATGEEFGRTAAMWTDLGEAGQIYGDQLGFSREQTGKFASAMGALGLALGAGQAAWEHLNRQREAWEAIDTASTDSMAGSFREGASETQALAEEIERLGGLQVRLFEKTVDATAVLDQYGFTMEDVVNAVAGGQDGIDRFREALEAAGADSNTTGLLVRELGFMLENVGAAAEASGAAARFFGDDAEEAMEGTADAADDATDAIEAVEGAFASASARIRGDRSVDDLEASFDELKGAALKAFVSAAEGSDEAGRHAKEYERKLEDVTLEALDLNTELDVTAEEREARIELAYNRGDIAALEYELNQLARLRRAQIQVESFYSQYNPQENPQHGTGASSTNVTVNLARTSDPRDVDAAVARWARIDGRR